MFGLFDRKKTVKPQDAAIAFNLSMVKACESHREEWRNNFIEGINGSGWVSEELPEEIDQNTLQWMMVASVMAIECLAIKNLFDARIASHLYDAVNAEIKKLSNNSGMDNLEDIVFGLMAQAEKDMNEAMLMPHDSVAGNLIQFMGFKPEEGSSDFFSPIHLMLISAPLLTIGSGFWKSVEETYNIKV